MRNPPGPAVAIRIDSPDPIAEIDALVQLSGRPEVSVAGPQQQPAVALAVLADLDDDALAWLRDLRAGCGLPIVVITGPAAPAMLVRLVEAGASGILGRADATADRLVRAIALAADGQGDLPPALVRHLLDRVGRLDRERFTPPGLPFTGLSGREREILALLADGLSTREVAARLAYPERMVKGVMQGVMLRLNVRNPTQAVACAVRNGWV
jgi:DNA-binding NarL/FixJ family response regulator